MNRAAEIEASMANIQYELEHDIYNPPVVKDNKPFNMSDYIKPVRVTDEDYETEKVASSVENNKIVDVDTDDLLKEYNALANEILQDDDLENEEEYENIEQLAKEESDKTYTENLIDANINNLKENLINSSDKIQGFKDTTDRFVKDNKDIANNVPEVAKDVATYTMTKMAPSSNAKKKIRSLRKLVELELRERKQKKKVQQDNSQKKNNLIGNAFIKQNKSASYSSEENLEKLAYYKSMIANRVNKMR